MTLAELFRNCLCRWSCVAFVVVALYETTGALRGISRDQADAQVLSEVSGADDCQSVPAEEAHLLGKVEGAAEQRREP